MSEKGFWNKLFGGGKEEKVHPIKDAIGMANAFEEDLTGRLDNIVGPDDGERVNFTVQPYPNKKGAGLSVRIHMNTDGMNSPYNTAQQICNAVYGAENTNEYKPDEIRRLRDTIGEYYRSGGSKKADDNLTFQANYLFNG